MILFTHELYLDVFKKIFKKCFFFFCVIFELCWWQASVQTNVLACFDPTAEEKKKKTERAGREIELRLREVLAFFCKVE